MLNLKTAPHQSSLTDLSTFLQNQSVCLNLKSFPKCLGHSYSLFLPISHVAQGTCSIWFPRLQAEENESKGHWKNMNLSHNCNLRECNPHCWKFSEYQFAVCTVDSSSLVWAGQEKIKLKSCAKYTGAQLGSLNAPTTQVQTIARSSLLNVFPWTTVTAICTSLHLCSTSHRNVLTYYL